MEAWKQACTACARRIHITPDGRDPATVAGDMEELDRLTPEQLARLDELLGDEQSPLMPLERGLLFASRSVFSQGPEWRATANWAAR